MDSWTRHQNWRNNPAALLAGIWYLSGDGTGERAGVILPYSDRLVTLSRYLQQLVMESLGKRENLAGEVVEQGLTIYGNKGSTDQHAYVQQLRDGRDDVFVHFVQVLSDGQGSPTPITGLANAGDYLQGFLLGTRRALGERQRPTLTLTIPEVNETELGGLIALFERAVGLYANLIGINAYHQPGVEAGKRAAKELLALSENIQATLGPTPQPADAIAQQCGADTIEVWYILERLVATDRATKENACYRRR